MNAAPGTPGGGLIRDNAELVELTGVSAGPGGDISLNALRSVAPLVGAAQFEKVVEYLGDASDVRASRRSLCPDRDGNMELHRNGYAATVGP